MQHRLARQGRGQRLGQHEVDPVLRRPVPLLIGHEERAVGLDAHADVNRAVGMSSLPMGVAVEIEAVFKLA